MTEEAIPSVHMLYCYAPEDRQWLEEIELHLSQVKRQCHMLSSFDGELVPGAERKEQLLAQFLEMDLVLLLISTHFKQVEAFWDEISHESWSIQWPGGCRVIALLLEAVEWSEVPFATRDVLPSDAKAVTQWQSQEQAFQDIEQGMRVIIEQQWLDRGNNLRDDGGGTLDEEALAAYNEALRLNPSISEAWYGKADVLIGLKRYDGALRASEEALRLDPTFLWAWYVKGIALVSLNRYDEALRASEEALRLDPTFSSAWYTKGDIFVGLERYDEALQAYEQVLRLKPSHRDAKEMLKKVRKKVIREKLFRLRLPKFRPK